MADAAWTDQEKFVWKRVCAGEIADLKKFGASAGGALRPAFIKTILVRDKYRSALTSFGVRVVGAHFTERIDLNHEELRHELRLEQSFLDEGADLSGLRSTHPIGFDGSQVGRNLNLDGLQLAGELSMRDGARFDAVFLVNARVDQRLDLSGSAVGDLQMNGLQVGRDLLMSSVGETKANFVTVDLTNAHVSGQLNLIKAKVSGTLNLDSIEVGTSLLMDDAELHDVILGAARARDIVLVGSKVSGKLNMIALEVGRYLLMGKGEFGGEVILTNARVGEWFELKSSKVAGKLDMTGLHVGNNLSMQKEAKFAEVVLESAHIGGSLDLDDSTVTGSLKMTGLHVAGNLFITGKAKCADVYLQHARIDGQLLLTVSAVTGSVRGYGIEVGEDVLLGDDTNFAGPINFRYATFKKALDLSGGIFHEDVDLTGTQISGELALSSSIKNKKRARWEKSAASPTLILHNSRADLIPNFSDAWPSGLDLNGFTYRGLKDIDAIQRVPFETWLDKMKSSSRQPYEQLAAVLQSYGLSETAADVRYAGRERERHETAAGWLWSWLTALNLVIGYGYDTKRAAYWALGFILLGAVVLRLSGQGRMNEMPIGLAFSFDMLLPIIKLRKRHDEIDLVGWARYYFYIHKIAGYLLAGFMLAGLSGLTK